MSSELTGGLCRLLEACTGGVTDAELVERFALAGDEAAFAALVGRHGGMVLGLCRRLLRDTHDAEDAFQATFLVLARSDAALRASTRKVAWKASSASWVSRSSRRHSPSTIPPWRPTRAAKAASSPASAKRSTSSASVTPPVHASSKRHSPPVSSEDIPRPSITPLYTAPHCPWGSTIFRESTGHCTTRPGIISFPARWLADEAHNDQPAAAPD